VGRVGIKRGVAPPATGVAPPATLYGSFPSTRAMRSFREIRGGLRPGADPRFYGIIYVTITTA